MSITRHHNDWLSLVPNSGPFLSLPVLSSAFPQGLDAHDADHARRLRMAFDEWDDNQLSNRPDPGLHRAWVKFVLGETLGYDELLAEGQAIPTTLKSEVAEYGETLRPDWIVNDPATNKARLIVQFFPRSQSLTKPLASSRWKTSPDTRMMQLLHDTGIRLGIITNGDHWMLVNAPKNETTGYASWYANLWLEEPVTQRAFRTVLGADRLFSVPEKETLEALLDKSAADQQEVTDQLGYQVRKAVEVLIQALDKADQDHGRKLLADVHEKLLYESALTVMMRLVFLFCAEERELLLLGDELYDKNYAVSTLREQLRVTADQFGEEILGLRYDAWTRLLTTFRAVYAGAKHDRLKLPAYGGSLFNPDRFPFLEGRKLGTNWKTTEATPLPISNRTVLHLLEALQVLRTKVGNTTEARKISFRALDIEQIGHVYEGLLDHTAKRATEPVLGLAGTRDKEPEIKLADLEKLLATEDTENTESKGKSGSSLSVSSVNSVAKYLTKLTGRSESALKKGLNAELDDQLASRFRTACQDGDLWKRVKPFAGLVRFDTVSYPVVITKGSVFVTGGTDRRSSGTHYTPKSLTEPIVQYTLEPLVYIGPAEGLPKEEWKLRSAKELLALKICDMACGSGAFLVQACRYMAARLLEAWQEATTNHTNHTKENQDKPTVIDPKTGELVFPSSSLSCDSCVSWLTLPAEDGERLLIAMRMIAQRCLYGVDINPLAVEMAKLSLWLLTLAKDKPFEFLDHAIRCGDSLVGIHNTEQLKKFNLDGKGADNRLFLGFLDEKIKEAIALRRQITEMQANTVEDVEAQDRMLREANEKIDRLKCAADFLIAAAFTPGSAADKRGARDDAAIKVAVHFNDSDLPTFRREAQKALGGQVTFHWPLEFPEVMVERGGFDAFVGNPPFMGGLKLETALTREYRAYLVSAIANNVRGTRGTADLCAYFVLQAPTLLHGHGTAGFVATNTICQGDTRNVGLDQIADLGLVVYRAISSLKWPGEASLEIALIWITKADYKSVSCLDERSVSGITSSLVEVGTVAGEPEQLRVNMDTAISGSPVIGMGFILTDEERSQLVSRNRKNAAVIYEYLTGEDTNSRPDQSPSRCIINFLGWPLDRDTAPARYDGPVAADYPDCLKILEERVRHERMAYEPKNPWNRKLRNEWWLFGQYRWALYAAIDGLPRVLVVAATSRTLAFTFTSPTIAFANTVYVFALAGWSDFGIMQSAFHEAWARTYSSSMKGDLRYRGTSCFETFVRPNGQFASDVSDAAKAYYEHRQQLMHESYQGLTATYNRYHDAAETKADIHKLRQLHVEMDNAVAAAYGWTDLDLGHRFHETKLGVRYTISEPARREVLARLLKLNHERYAEEVKQGLHEKKKPKSTQGKKEAKANTQSGPSLFHGEEDA